MWVLSGAEADKSHQSCKDNKQNTQKSRNKCQGSMVTTKAEHIRKEHVVHLFDYGATGGCGRYELSFDEIGTAKS